MCMEPMMMKSIIQEGLTWLQLEALAKQVSKKDQEAQDLANAAVVMAKKQFKESLTKYWSEQIESKMKEEQMIKEISDMLGEINNEKRDLV